jgi:MFS family permease
MWCITRVNDFRKVETMNKIPRGVWMLGFVSMFMDISSEMIHSVLPLFVVGTLGMSATLLGTMEGIAEATAQIGKLFSGVLSDRWRNRKNLALFGYGLAAIVKPLFPLASSFSAVFVARFADRVGKGIRGAPRDAMVADMTSVETRGAAFGLRQSLDTVGAFLGPLIAVVLIGLWATDLRTVLWVACVPALIAVFILATGVQEPPRSNDNARKAGLNSATIKNLGGAFWAVAALGAAVMLARFSEAFLVLRASDAKIATAYVPLVMVVMSLVYSLSSYPVGVLSDKWGRKKLFAAGLIALIVADLVLAWAPSPTWVMVGIGIWGLHMGLTQGILSALIADASPTDLRGTAYGVFALVSGIAALAASVTAGVVWDKMGQAPVFYIGAGFALLALALLLFQPKSSHQ